MQFRSASLVLLAQTLAASLLAPANVRPADDLRAAKTSRQPMALAFAGERLFVANRRSGTISAIDPARGTIAAEYAVGERLSDMIATPDGRSLLVTDETREQLILLSLSGQSCQVVQRLSIGGSPVTVCAAHKALICSVASLWAHRVTLVAIRSEDAAELKVLGQIDLPFAPRLQCLSPDDARLYVADAFGGQIGVIDTAAAKLVSICRFDGHNIRGLAWNDEKQELLAAHQILDEQIATTESHISSGKVISNVVRSIPAAELATLSAAGALAKSGPSIRQLARSILDSLGKTGNGMGDPGSILPGPDGRLAVLISGVDKVAFRDTAAKSFDYFPVGAHPVALAADPGGRRLFVANQFDDSISVVDLQNATNPETINLGPRVEPTFAERGERLFYDARLSLDGWFSCHSCHTDGHTNGLKNDNLGDGTFGFPKRIPSLLGTEESWPWAWNGRQSSLTNQVHSSIQTTMHGPSPAASTENIAALVAWLDTLTAPPGVTRARGAAEPESMARGGTLFRELGCTTCHPPPQFTARGTYDVGIHGSRGETEFNPPSLLGVSQRGPYFHDGRAASLRDVFAKFHHGDTQDVSAADFDALLAYLNGL